MDVSRMKDSTFGDTFNVRSDTPQELLIYRGGFQWRIKVDRVSCVPA